MTCPACDAAASNPISGIYRLGCNGCKECAARLLSRSIEHTQARAAGRMLPAYMARLQAVFGDDWSAGHQRVKAWVLKVAA